MLNYNYKLSFINTINKLINIICIIQIYANKMYWINKWEIFIIFDEEFVT